LTALTHRQLLPSISTPEVRSELWSKAGRIFKDDIFSTLGDKTVQGKVFFDEHIDASFDDWVSKYPVTRRNALYRAKTNLDMDSTFWTPITKGFTKKEWLTGKDPKKRHPRMISGKTDEYLVMTGPQYHSWQKSMCKNLWGDLEARVSTPYVYSGGLDGFEVGEIVSYYESMGWRVFEGDYSRYDGHTEIEALEAELNFYKAFGMSGEQLDLFRQQLTTKGTINGISYKHVGKRNSGVINTSFGNTIVGFMIVALARYEFGIDMRVIQLGDDNIIFVPPNSTFELARFVNLATKLGHKLEITERTYDTLEYCSQMFVPVSDSLRIMCPKIGRFLAKSFMPKYDMNDQELIAHCSGVAQGYKNYSFLPVIEFLCSKLTDRAHSTPTVKVENEFGVYLSHKHVGTITFDRELIETYLMDRYGASSRAICGEFNDVDWTQPSISVESDLLNHILYIDGVISSDTCFF